MNYLGIEIDTMLSPRVRQKLINCCSWLGSGLALSLALSLAVPASLLAKLRAAPAASQPQPAAIAAAPISQPKEADSALADGIYLYGQSPQPEQLGQEYLVFKVQAGRVIGAFYMPRSEFACFSGTVNSRQMQLSIVDPYDNTVSPYTIALQELSPVANSGQLSRAVGLEGYHQISEISNLDRHILGICLNSTSP